MKFETMIAGVILCAVGLFLMTLSSFILVIIGVIVICTGIKMIHQGWQGKTLNDVVEEDRRAERCRRLKPIGAGDPNER